MLGVRVAVLVVVTKMQAAYVDWPGACSSGAVVLTGARVSLPG